MLSTIKEVITEAIASGMYEEEYVEALETELMELHALEKDVDFLECLKATGGG